MKKMHKPIRTLVSVAVAGMLSASVAHSGAFSLYSEGTGSAIGNYAAGIAAEAADASTGWYNPAGLALIHKTQMVGGGVGVFPSSRLNGTSTFTTTGLPNFVQNFNGLDGAENALVPSFHYALPLGENATFGFSAVSPFGLATDWQTDSEVRYQTTFTELLTINVSPEIGAKISEHFAVGAGIDFQYARVKYNRMLGVPTLYAPFNPAAVDTLSYNNGNSIGVGFHTGVMTMFNDQHTRVGLNYQSKMRHKFHGQSRLTGKLASPGIVLGLPDSVLTANPDAVFKNNQLSSNAVDLPDIVTLSGYHDLNETIAILGSVVYTGWSSFKDVELNNVAAPSINPNTTVSLVQVNRTSAQNYSDVWRFALGANYRVNPLLMLRVGGGYDATPTNNIDRDVRLPDSNRWALSVGAHYQARPSLGVDVGYTHLFADDPEINRFDRLSATSTYTVNATGKAYADLVGAQVVWTIDKEPETPYK
ncbi:OmpP1/FadL family transporter [Legionella antarctica]|nr:outer membrane protein transport protein [Legionella antarctica]